MGAVQTGVQFGGIFYEGNKSFLCDTKHTISLSGAACLRTGCLAILSFETDTCGHLYRHRECDKDLFSRLTFPFSES